MGDNPVQARRKLDTVFVENMMDPAEQINFEAYRWLDKNDDGHQFAISKVPLLGPDGKPVRDRDVDRRQNH